MCRIQGPLNSTYSRRARPLFLAIKATVQKLSGTAPHSPCLKSLIRHKWPKMIHTPTTVQLVARSPCQLGYHQDSAACLFEKLVTALVIEAFEEMLVPSDTAPRASQELAPLSDNSFLEKQVRRQRRNPDFRGTLRCPMQQEQRLRARAFVRLHLSLLGTRRCDGFQFLEVINPKLPLSKKWSKTDGVYVAEAFIQVIIGI